MTNILRQVISGIVAALALIGLISWTDFVFWFSLLISAMIGLGTYFSLPTKKSDHDIEVAPGITREQYLGALSMLEDFMDRFLVEEKKCPEKKVSVTIGNIRKTLGKIHKNFKHDPADLSMAHQFLNQHLEKSFKIISQYNRLAAMDSDNRLSKRLDHVEETIKKIQAAFDAFYQKCLQNDLLHLEVESETLGEIIEMENPFLDLKERSSR